MATAPSAPTDTPSTKPRSVTGSSSSGIGDGCEPRQDLRFARGLDLACAHRLNPDVLSRVDNHERAVSLIVMPGLDPGIHSCTGREPGIYPLDGRDKPGHDGMGDVGAMFMPVSGSLYAFQSFALAASMSMS